MIKPEMHKLSKEEKHKKGYEFWFMFMRESKASKHHWNKEVRSHFHDAKEVTFEEWWKSVSEMLELCEPFGCAVIETEEEFRQWNDEFGVIVTLDLFSSKRKILQEVSSVIDRLMPSKSTDLPVKKRGAQPFSPKTADLPFACEMTAPRLESLLKMYKVYIACETAEHHRAIGAPYEFRYQIGERLGLCQKIKKNDPDIAAKKNEASVVVSRYYRWAQEVIQNSERGIFPKHSSSVKTRRSI